MRARLHACALLVAALLTGPLSAQDAPLRHLDPTGPVQAWDPVGRLDVRGKGFCTGTLISTNLVLTAAHCVRERGARVAAGRVTFRAGLQLGRSHTTSAARRIFTPSETGAGVNDIALIELARPVSWDGFFPARLGTSLTSGAPLSVVSYALGRAEAPSHQARCRALGQSAGLHVLSCSAGLGSSGAPVFAATHEGPRLVGVILGVSTLEGAPVSLAQGLGAPLEDLLASVVAGVDEDVP